MTEVMQRLTRATKPDAQGFDEIRIRTVPRFKDSEMSGCEWRISTVVEFKRNGKIVHEIAGYRNIELTCNFMGFLHAQAIDLGHGFYAGESDYCDQEGCAQPATTTLQLKATYCQEGHPTTPSDCVIRRFCDRHKYRGDQGFEDSDRNYLEIPNPIEIKEPSSDESR